MFFFSLCLSAQSEIIFAENLKINTDDNTKNLLLSSIKSLFQDIDNETLNESKITKNEIEKFSLERISDFKTFNENYDLKQKNFYNKQVINLYLLNEKQWIATVLYSQIADNQKEDINAIIKLFITIEKNNQITYSIPLPYLTKDWKKKVVQGNTYFYPDEINVKRAKIFSGKNKKIAEKLNLKVENFKFYLCNNFQEILPLLGIDYSKDLNGNTENGNGVEVQNYIFSVKHNEDFSHDVCHFYTDKIRKNSRNWFAEEGFAYCWGDAYWTKPNGETISQKELVFELKNYLKLNSNADLLEMFDKNPILFKYLSVEVKLNKILAGIICDEVEKTKGIEGAIQLLNCGKGEDNFFKATKQLAGIDRTNFNEKIKEFLNL